MLSLWLAVAIPCSAGPVAVGDQEETLRVISRSNPSFPPEAREAAARCVFQVEIDERGRATASTAFGCPQPFADAGAAALRRWRWAPPRVDGAPARGRDLIETIWIRDRAPLPPLPDRCEHRLAVASDGALTPAPGDPSVACAAAFPDEGPPPPVSLSCAIDIRRADGKSELSLGRCPEEARPWIEGLVERTSLSKAGSHALWIDAAIEP